jgi:hypothetical protein
MMGVERFRRAVGFVAAVFSMLLMLAGVNLLFACWLFWTRHQFPGAMFWGASGIALIAYGSALILELARGPDDPRRGPRRAMLRAAAIVLTIAGVAWAIQTEAHWRTTGEWEAYGVVIGAIMAIEGAAAFGWTTLPRGVAQPTR